MEFKRLSDVEVVAEPTESANVLIEEDGVIKKAPKTAVGGVGGNNIIAVTFTRKTDGSIISSMTYDEIVGAAQTGAFIYGIEMYEGKEQYTGNQWRYLGHKYVDEDMAYFVDEMSNKNYFVWSSSGAVTDYN